MNGNCGNCLKVSEIAQRLKISRAHAYQLVKRDDFPKIVLGKRLVIPEQGFVEWVEKNSQTAASAI